MLRKAAVVLMVGSLAGCGERGLVCSESFAYGAAKSIMEKRLASPGSAKFASLGNSAMKVEKLGACKFRVHSFVDSQNGFGALVRTSFAITVEGMKEEKAWQGSDLVTR